MKNRPTVFEELRGQNYQTDRPTGGRHAQKNISPQYTGGDIIIKLITDLFTCKIKLYFICERHVLYLHSLLRHSGTYHFWSSLIEILFDLLLKQTNILYYTIMSNAALAGTHIYVIK